MIGIENLMSGLEPQEQAEMAILAQSLIGIAMSHPAGRIFNACMAVQFFLAHNDPMFAGGCVAPLKSLVERLESMAQVTALLDTQPAPPGTLAH